MSWSGHRPPDGRRQAPSLRGRFDGIHFRPHDSRRPFATELVNNGLPIHIGAALLRHLDLETTRGYVAVFNEDVTRHYQAHLQRPRALRPPDEYPPVTAADWVEFEAHFDKRNVELGGCGRPYASHAATNTPVSAAPCSTSTPRCSAPRRHRSQPSRTPRPCPHRKLARRNRRDRSHPLIPPQQENRGATPTPAAYCSRTTHDAC
ncbi:tyrosine-type recombinase/integrase [Gordonia jinghuaiqii]|uniref:tyrosine-type recombinase/integrase n=1 Tax=Gordonia jinghuaiqii TaxID=2758710 RepID=UPI001C614A3C